MTMYRPDDREKVNLNPPRSAPSIMPYVFGTGCLLLIVMVVYLVRGGIQTVNKLTGPQTREIADAVMMLSLADEKVIKESSTQINTQTLASTPASHLKKWLKLEGIIQELMSQDGKPISVSQAQQDGDTIYWLDGPVVVMVVSDEQTTVFPPGSKVTAFGRAITTTESEMGMDQQMLTKVQAIPGYNPQHVAMLIAKWIE